MGIFSSSVLGRRKRPWTPPKQTKPTTRELNRLAIEQLLASGIDPYVYRRQLNADLSVSERLLIISKIDDSTGVPVDFASTKNWASLPLGDKKRRAEIELPLRRFCQVNKGIFWGVVRLSAPCTARSLRQERVKLFSRLVDVFELGKRDYGVELFFGIAHEPAKTRRGAIRKDAGTAQLLYAIHLHFLFRSTRERERLDKFIGYFETKFPKCIRIRKVKSKQRKISYLLTRPDYETILGEKQFAAYHAGVAGSSRIRTYGKFRRTLKRYRDNGIKVIEELVVAARRGREIRYALALKDSCSRPGRAGSSRAKSDSSFVQPNTLLFNTEFHSYVANRQT